jgi:phospholipid:diacylglycerol acyltransferase
MGEERNIILTHVTADGASVPFHLMEHPCGSSDNDKSGGEETHLSPPCDFLREETAEDDLSSTDGDCKPTYAVRKTTKYTLFALAVFLGQIAISVSLKRYGLLEKDFNEIVAERVVPHIESSTGLRMPQFNESLYWLRSFNQTLPSMNAYVTQAPALRPGFQLAEKGAKSKYPVIMVPGFVTSALEVWQGKECAKQLFRQRVWGGIGMVQHFLMDRHCVLEHMALDPMTGKDPENIRVRAAAGFEAADYFAGNYWVWSKLLENLADLGYDGNMMSMESYDWRLSFPMLEERDGYLTKLKYRIEAFHRTSGQKVVLTSHSLGCSLVHYFFAWVTTSEKQGGGGGGKDWVDKHIHTYINIAGAQLGAPKSASSLLSGEMSDTVILGPVGSLIEQFMGRKIRRDLWTTWGSLWSLLPKGGAALWNVGADLQGPGSPTSVESETNADDDFAKYMVVLTDEETVDKEDIDDQIPELEDFVGETMRDPELERVLTTFSAQSHHTLDSVTDFLRQWGGGLGPNIASSRYHSFDPQEKPSRATWHDISRTPLPSAPKMKIYCLYGVGLQTERAYYYKRNRAEAGSDNHSQSKSQRNDPPFILDTSVEDPANNVIHGVKYVDGDGSVPLLSLGYICADGWRRKDTGLNPGKSKVVTREYQHKQETPFDDPMRGGPYSGEHVDVMGNLDMMTDFLKVVSDFEDDTVEDHFVSDIHEIAEKISKHPRGGLQKRRRWPF